MNRKKFTGLIIMMLLSIIGIIWVQSVWIKKAIEIQNESFNSYVRMSLINAASSIESSRERNFFNNFMPTDPLSMNDSASEVSGFMSIGNSVPENKLSISITNQQLEGDPNTGKITTTNKSYIIRNDNSVVTDSVTYVSAPD